MTRNTVCVCDVAALLDVRREKGRRKKLFDGRRELFLRHVRYKKYSCTKLGIGTVECKEKPDVAARFLDTPIKTRRNPDAARRKSVLAKLNA